MPFELTIGRPGSGKSLHTAKTTVELLDRSVWIKKKLNKIRKVAINFHLSAKLMDKYKEFIIYWTDPMELIHLKDYDLVIDEIANYFPSDKWKDTHHEIRRMFAQHRKRGMEIFANTQDYRMVDINARRMLSRVFQLRKVVGNRSPSPTLPKIRIIWGLIALVELDPETLEDDKDKVSLGWPSFFFIRRKYVEIYDTLEDIKPAPAPGYHHIDRVCATCGFVKSLHI